MASKSIPGIPQVAELLRILQVKAKKQLSQNFLLDSSITDKFAQAAGGLRDDFVIEVGGGPGALSRSLLRAEPRRLIVIEKDRRMLPMLDMLREARPETTIVVHGDALDIDYQALVEEHWIPPTTADDNSGSTGIDLSKPAVQVVGNLPFGVATPLLMNFLRMAADNSGVFCRGPAGLTLAFQKEVAFRMIAPPHSRYRCRLSAATQRYCHVTHCFDISPRSFIPPPKVDTSVVHLQPHRNLEALDEVDYNLFELVCTAVFRARRRKLRHGVRTLFNNDMAITDEFLERVQLHTTTAARLKNEELLRLARAYAGHVRMHPELDQPASQRRKTKHPQAQGENAAADAYNL
eukprot:TRINITY_DN12157_c0_g2_i2.p2 TRINITY_DN12157_c0_g2~~TRINITY_DN12157_c0_g2_i2.p2  ORF type:complete len:349 (+),score=43.99 TRINITY_DN12157_c0_g2_i2:47-1093(+)